MSHLPAPKKENTNFRQKMAEGLEKYTTVLKYTSLSRSQTRKLTSLPHKPAPQHSQTHCTKALTLSTPHRLKYTHTTVTAGSVVFSLTTTLTVRTHSQQHNNHRQGFALKTASPKLPANGAPYDTTNGKIPLCRQPKPEPGPAQQLRRSLCRTPNTSDSSQAHRKGTACAGTPSAPSQWPS